MEQVILFYNIQFSEYSPRNNGPFRTINQEYEYDIEDFDDIFNVLEDIFDLLRPRDEY